MRKSLTPYRKSSFNYKERPFNVGPENNRHRNAYGRPGVKLNRDRINRSYKKGLRQSFQKDIRQQLQELSHV